MRIKHKERAIAILMLASATTLSALFISQVSPAYAYYTDVAAASASGTAGTVQITGPDLQFLAPDPGGAEPVVSGGNVTVWDPGDVSTIQWEVDNAGNKSADLRYIINLYWDAGPGMTTSDNETASDPMWEENGYVYLYPATMSDAAIQADLATGSPSQYVTMDAVDTEMDNASGATRYGSTLTVDGPTLDGIGNDAETGDATSSGQTSDLVQYKVALSPNTPAGYMDKTLSFNLTVYAKQHRNTSDGDWSAVESATAQ